MAIRVGYVMEHLVNQVDVKPGRSLTHTSEVALLPRLAGRVHPPAWPNVGDSVQVAGAALGLVTPDDGGVWDRSSEGSPPRFGVLTADVNSSMSSWTILRRSAGTSRVSLSRSNCISVVMPARVVVDELVGRPKWHIQ